MITIKKLISKKTGKPFICATVTDVYGKDHIVTFDTAVICMLAGVYTSGDLNEALDNNSGSLEVTCIIKNTERS